MPETAEVRLVRCPKCKNLLPEVTGYSVYRCGGCGAVLRGDKGFDLDSFSERSDEEKVAMMKGKYLEKYEKKDGMSDGMSSISSSSRAERRALRDSAANHGDSLMDRENLWEHGGRTIQDRDLDELGRASVARNFEDLTLYNDDENRMRRLDQVSEEHGSSNLVSRPNYDYLFEVKNRVGVDGFNKDGYVGEDRPKILRGLDGRNERLSRYGYLNDRGKEKTFLDRPIAHDQDSRSSSENWYPNKSLGMNSSSRQYPYLGARFNRPSYQNQYPEPSLMHRLEMGGDGYNPSRYALNRVQQYEGPLRSEMLRRGPFPFRSPPPYQQPSSHPNSSGSYAGDGMANLDPFEPYNPSDNYHHNPSCSCFHCFRTRQVPQPVAFSDKFSDVSADTLFNYQKHPGSFSPQDYNFQATNHHPLRSHNPFSHTGWPSDVNSEVDGFIRRHPPRVHSASAVLHCRPIGGGAPFFVCFNCFELLILPKKVATNSDRKKIKCGSCSVVIVFAFSNNKLVICDDVEATTDSPVKLDDNSNLSPIRGEIYMHGHLNQVGTTFSSDDYDNTGFDFESMDREPEPSPGWGRGSNTSETKHQSSKSKHTIEVEKVTESLNVLREDPKLAYEERMNKEPPPPVGSSLQEYFEYSNKFHVKNSQGSHEKYLPSKTTRQQFSVNDSSAATETDVSSNEFSNTGTSLDSREANRKGRKASESFFAGIVKKSFKEFSRSNQNAEKEKADVTINGHQMPNEVIKRAEEVAGPIHPGQYWYDYRAGFWGLMGSPCLGIIPPGIKEFNHPMLEKCAGGNTGIYVNGRELNQKDLNLLKRRGMPTDRNRSYAIEISGRIIDKDTGVELKSLGKLAPSMEKLQRGFGMRVPKGARLS